MARRVRRVLLVLPVGVVRPVPVELRAQVHPVPAQDPRALLARRARHVLVAVVVAAERRCR